MTIMWRFPYSHLAILAVAVVIAGCSSPLRFSQYSGPTFGYYPNSLGSMSETTFKIPVYRTWPDRPFKIIGSLRFEDANAWWNDDIIGQAAAAGKAKGADALIIRRGAELGVGKIIGVPSQSVAYFDRQTTALVVKWLSPAEESTLVKVTEQAAASFIAANPDVRGNSDVEKMSLQLLLQQKALGTIESLDPRDLVALLEKVRARSSNGFDGTWIYKGSLEASSLTTQDQDSFLGTATVRMDGDRITIVSDSGKTEVNFNGTFDKGGVSGQLGISGFALKADGAAVENKISLSFQTRTPDGTIKGNITLQRLTLKQ